MDLRIEELLKTISEFLQAQARSETVVGAPFKLADYVCVPIVRIGMGFGGMGMGGGNPAKSKGEGAGAGAGVGIEPVGFLVNKGDHIEFISTHHSKGLSAAIEKVPDLLARYFENRQDRKAEEKKTEESDSAEKPAPKK